ncbi:hypothetical protein B0P06_004555 [Clostridium saccharoperbutylacetonicum]|uniref:GNAT family N-acetyltransferase n=1 Tax=Clostridium saccharoperbutylacetonicum N1-4(HMT) TaxID=931276 RepID=M1MQY0_9CLOT|nr:hypothetical protein [Clostridium saccharoperbutylacetonicum]AGF57156.1 hypothetical protein Cspa_c33950 [Clostridium saccharoperbutylacetonicum N1-4(HMT)]NRT62085.1 hypothetical protein [Clostridium saccharoperbutylacetonicum]NSB25415.1 hypothetical protein [Clostridium saccharoperbutylacetonicum]NSB44784.1 hypothetical protein [Clostridium saccharoperbutylacetonicum]
MENKNKFVPDDFIVPIEHISENFTIRKLTALDLKEDYIAVMEAKEHIHELYTEEYTNGWPADNLTIEEDEMDLIRHEKEFDERVAFAYTVFDLENKNCLGCLYIDPSNYHDAEITMWTRNSITDELLYRTIKNWIKRDWPFKNVNYPIFEELYYK